MPVPIQVPHLSLSCNIKGLPAPVLISPWPVKLVAAGQLLPDAEADGFTVNVYRGTDSTRAPPQSSTASEIQ